MSDRLHLQAHSDTSSSSSSVSYKGRMPNHLPPGVILRFAQPSADKDPVTEVPFEPRGSTAFMSRKADDGSSSGGSLQDTPPEEMLSLALGQPENWALRERPTLVIRSHSQGNCVPCVFFALCNRCYFGDRCGCCHSSSHQNATTMLRFRFASRKIVKAALQPQKSLPQAKAKAAYQQKRLSPQAEGSSGAQASTTTSTASRSGTSLKTQEETEDPEAWRSMDLRNWLLSIDNGRGCLLRYEQSLTANFDSLDQIVDLYIRKNGRGRVVVDSLFFTDLQIKKVGHQRLIEKWFRERAAHVVLAPQG
ncbi:unnamed protein product [Effrenium voratum]|uniref:Uncharacterized protein n=1 Tax=Effrenium voratum TaxID=2562239 RepID=A0AA36JFV2_9DINO|nr:unnamed protein product [Effrenium voratum]